MRHEMLPQRAPFCIGAMAKKGTLSQHFVTHVVPPLDVTRPFAFFPLKGHGYARLAMSKSLLEEGMLAYHITAAITACIWLIPLPELTGLLP